MTNNNRTIGDFLIGRGGPFYEVQQRLGLLREDAFRAGSRALLFVGLAWGVPLVLSIIAGNAVGPPEQRPFLLDPWPWARYFAAVGLLILTERQVEEQLRTHQRQFALAPLLGPAAIEAAAPAVLKALRRRDSRLAESVCLAIALLGSFVSLFGTHDPGSIAWVARPSADGFALTAAGWWSVLVSGPLFGFLVLRWFWRYIVWALLLRDLSALELRLVAAHPDGHGGLGFIGRYPNTYVGYVFALSCVIAASVFEFNQRVGMELTVYGAIMGIWLAFVLLVFALPLTAFIRPLTELKVRTLLASSAQATRHFRAVERDVLGRNLSASADAESTPTADNPDPSKIFTAAKKCSTLPFTREAWLPISVAALAPLIAAGANQLPIKELVEVAKRLLLL